MARSKSPNRTDEQRARHALAQRKSQWKKEGLESTSEYQRIGLDIFDGICRRYLTEGENGINLGGICLLAGLGNDPKRDGSFEYYISEPIVENDAKGVGPFIMAYTEIIRLEK